MCEVAHIKENFQFRHSSVVKCALGASQVGRAAAGRGASGVSGSTIRRAFTGNNPPTDHSDHLFSIYRRWRPALHSGVAKAAECKAISIYKLLDCRPQEPLCRQNIGYNG